MDISNNVGKEICCGSKKVRISDESRDFISELPDHILVHILSFLPIQEAIKTVLLRRFGNLWHGIQVLDFNSDLNEHFVGLIRHVLNLHDSSVLDKLCLKFEFFKVNGCHYQLEWVKGTSDQLEKLIRYALRRNVKVLDLNLRPSGAQFPEKLYDLPDILSSNHLTDLKLAGFNIKFCTIIDLKLLKVLSLSLVRLNNETMEKILFGCPSLEDLSLIDCYGLGRLLCLNSNLKKLMLTLSALENEILVILCPYVLSLEINGCLQRAFLLHVSSTVDISIHYSDKFRCKQPKYVNVISLLLSSSRCKTFSLCSWTILVCTIWNFMNVHCPSFEWKHLNLKNFLTKWHHPGLSLLLRNSQRLETLTIKIHTSSGSGYKFTRAAAIWFEAHEFDIDKYWDSQEATFPCLRMIMIYGCVNDPHVMEMVKFLLRSAIRLRKLVISTLQPSLVGSSGFTSEQLQELSGKHKSLPRASPEAMIYFS